MPMANAANTLILIAVFVAVHAAQAADPATSNGSDASGSARPEPDIAPPALDGAQLFATHCAMCHKPADLARRLQGAADPKAARADMAAFLARRPQRCRRGCGNHRLSREQQGAVAALKRAAMRRARGACRKLAINELDLNQ
jgi:mono/diheme cytochrome c family protein